MKHNPFRTARQREREHKTKRHPAAIAKICPRCESPNHSTRDYCFECGEVFPMRKVAKR